MRHPTAADFQEEKTSQTEVLGEVVGNEGAAVVHGPLMDYGLPPPRASERTEPPAMSAGAPPRVNTMLILGLWCRLAWRGDTFEDRSQRVVSETLNRVRTETDTRT